MDYQTKQQIIDELVGNLSEYGKQDLSEMDEKELGMLHHGYGTHIRNKYRLWEAGNPLTKQWFDDSHAAKDGKHAYLIDGVDCHPQHPDQMSQEIIIEIWKRAKAEIDG